MNSIIAGKPLFQFKNFRQSLFIFDPTGKAFELMLTDRSSLNLEQILETFQVRALLGRIQAVGGSLKFEPLSAIVMSPERPVRVLI